LARRYSSSLSAEDKLITNGLNLDMELHLRLKKAGKRILLVPAMVGHYYARTTIGPYLRYCFINGYWLTLPLRFTPHMLSARHSIPMLFVAVTLQV
jgi:GT2 family glycosyltransferase